MSAVELSEIQIDALREIGNIGAGNAATALSQMIHKTITIGISRISIIAVDEMDFRVPEMKHSTLSTKMKVVGDIEGSILLNWVDDKANILVDLLTEKPLGTTKILDEFDKSAIKEVGSILSIAYLNSIGSFLQFSIIPSVPAFLSGEKDEILEAQIRELNPRPGLIFLIETAIGDTDIIVKGDFFLIPAARSLEMMLLALWVPTSSPMT